MQIKVLESVAINKLVGHKQVDAELFKLSWLGQMQVNPLF